MVCLKIAFRLPLILLFYFAQNNAPCLDDCYRCSGVLDIWALSKALQSSINACREWDPHDYLGKPSKKGVRREGNRGSQKMTEPVCFYNRILVLRTSGKDPDSGIPMISHRKS